MSNILDNTISAYFKDRDLVREPHKDRLYPTHSSVYVESKGFKRLQGMCLRAAYYSCTGIPEDIALNTDRRLAILLGEYTEDMLLDIYKRQGILVDKAVKFNIDKYNIFGKVDCIIKEDDNDIGVEIKSIGSNKYSIDLIFGNKYKKPYPKWQNLFQTLVYCYAFRDRIPYFYLQYIRRDTCERKIFKVSIEPQRDGKIYPVIDGLIDYRFTINDILERYKLLYSYIEKEKVPPMEYIKVYNKKDIDKYVKIGFISQKQADMYKIEPFGDFTCKYCGYRKICDGEK